MVLFSVLVVLKGTPRQARFTFLQPLSSLAALVPELPAPVRATNPACHSDPLFESRSAHQASVGYCSGMRGSNVSDQGRCCYACCWNENYVHWSASYGLCWKYETDVIDAKHGNNVPRHCRCYGWSAICERSANGVRQTPHPRIEYSSAPSSHQ